jgi:EmrB/QacA subfamily drug resistance transporter
MAENFVNKKTQVSIIAVATLSFLGILVETSLNVTFPLLTHEFSVSLSTIQWVTSGYLLMVTIVMSATGFLNNRFNAKNLFRVALLFNLIGTILCVLSQQFIVLFLGRLLQAISTGIATPLMYHIILSVVPVGKRGTYMGLAAMIISLAPALGPTYGGTLSAFSSWRAIFIITIPVILLAAWIGERNISLVPNKTDQKFDWWGIILLAITFGSLSLSFANAGNYGFTSYRFIEMLIVFCLTTLVFGFKMQHSSKKILDFKLLLQPVVGLRWINFFVLQFINIGISFVIPLFLENRLHVNSFITGLVLLPGALAGALISPYAGRLFDHSGAFRPLLFSSITLISGTGLFFATSSKISVWGVTLLYILSQIARTN